MPNLPFSKSLNIPFRPREQEFIEAGLRMALYFIYLFFCHFHAQVVSVSPTDCLDSGSYHGPRWRMEPGDLFIPVDSIEEEATLTCDAKGIPAPQYR